MVEETEVITIRVPIALKMKLEEKAKKEQQTLNSTINKLLFKEFNWDEYTSDLGWMQFDPSVIREIFSHLNEEQITKIAEQSKKVIISNIRFIYEYPTLDNSIEFITSWLKSSKMSYRLVKNGHYKLTVSHDLGKNWSIFANLLTKKWFEELGFRFGTHMEEVKNYSLEVFEK